MDKYVSRSYLNEKYQSLKWDMEHILEVDNDKLADGIDSRDVELCINNVNDMTSAIRRELGLK